MKIQDSITHRRVLVVAVPIVISNITVPILGVVDTAVVGQIGQAAPIGAVGIGAIILSAIYWIFGFLRMGTVGLTGLAYGAGNYAEVRAMFFRAMFIALMAGALLLALKGPLFRFSFWLSPASDQVESLAQQYMNIRIYSAAAAIAIYGISGWLIAQERTTALLIIQVFMNGINIALDVLFVMGFGWGVAGVAYATFIAEWGGFILGLWLCRDAFANKAYRAWNAIFETAKLRRLASVNLDILIRSVLLQIAFVSFMFFGADFGDATLAANQLLLQFLHVTSYAMDGFAFAAEALVSQAVGAGSLARMRRSVVLSSFWGGIICLCLAVAFFFFGAGFIAQMAKSLAVQSEANTYLIWMVLAPITGAAAWMLDGIFIGATRAREMRNMMIVSFAIYGLCLWLFLELLENHGLWLSLNLFFIARWITLGLYYPSLERSLGR